MLESEASMTDGKPGYHDQKAFLHTESPTCLIHITRQTTKSASVTKKQQQIRGKRVMGICLSLISLCYMITLNCTEPIRDVIQFHD